MDNIYILKIKKIEEPSGMIVSSFISARKTMSIEYFASKSSAERRKAEIIAAIGKIGLGVRDVEVEISSAELKP